MTTECEERDPRGRKPLPRPSALGWFLVLPLFWLSGPLARWFCNHILPEAWRGERTVWVVWILGLALVVLLLRWSAGRVHWLFRTRGR